MKPSLKKKILITDRITEASELYLRQFSFLQINKTSSPHLKNEDLLGVHGLLIRSRTNISEELLKNSPNLQVIVTCTSGFDHIDLVAARKWGITVMFAPEANVQATAELTWMHALLLARKFPQTQVLIQSELWKKEHAIGTELLGKNYGIVGLGRVGRKVCEFAQAFQMKVFAYDPFIETEVFEKCGALQKSLEELFENCDFISLHVPKTEQTRNMINEHILSKARGQLHLINTSRGSVISENDLLDALEQKKLVGCAMDVFQTEPLSLQSRLLQTPQIIATPHIGANTEEAFEKASQLGAAQISSFFQDGTTSHTLPPKVAWYFEG